MQVELIQHFLENAHVLSILAGFFGFGILLAFNPCLFPTWPLVLAIIGTKKVSYLSAYVFGAACSYVLFGIVGGIFSVFLTGLFQTVLFKSITASILILFGVALFYENLEQK